MDKNGDLISERPESRINILGHISEGLATIYWVKNACNLY
jgi:hypothetical protein